MARQDQTIRYSIEVDGDAGLKKIADGLNEIATSSSDAAPAATALLEQLKSLASQNALATNLVADKAALVDLGNELFLAKQKAADLQAQFEATATPTASLSRALDKANASVASLSTQYDAMSLNVVKASNALAAAGVDATDLDAAQRGLQASIAGVRAEAAGLATSFDAANAAGQREALTMTEIADRSEILRAGFTQLKTLLTTFAGILAFEKIKTDIGEVLDTGDKFTKWGLQFSAAFGGAEQGEEALAKVKAIADATPLSLDDVTKAALQAKKEGLDPFDGSLQTLIDTTLKFGGGSDQLQTLITALGRSANQGGLSVKTLTTLEQDGIPAAKLLGDATGRTADEITDLAKQGKLGADSVKTLISALGKSSTGGAAAQFGLLSTQVTKAKDNYDEFLNLIAKSGAYSFVEQQLAALNTAFKKGLEDGSAQESAQAISDALVKLGQTLISITKFAVDHGSAILEVAEDYAIFKAAMLGVDFVGAAQRFLALADATKAVGVAAEAAAVGGGLGKLGNIISAIPRNVQIGIAVAGAEFAISETLKVIDTLTKITELQNQQAQQQKDDLTLKDQLVAKANEVAQVTKAAADTQILSADELATKNRAQSDAYIQSLQDAIKYFTAISVIDKQLGDTSGAAAASAHVRDLSVALQDATTHAKEVKDSIAAVDDAVESIIDKFIELRTSGVSSLQAVEGAFKNVDFTTPVGLEETLQIVQKLSGLSDDAAQAVQSELAIALSKLDATDLGNFQKNVSDKIKAAGQASQEAALTIKASLQAELLQLGLSAEQAQIGVTKAGQQIIDTFTNIANNATASANTIQLAFAQALTRVTTTGEVQALESQLKSAFDAGKISADQFAASMGAAGRKAADLQAAAIESAASLDGMGTAGQNASQRIVQALEDAKDKVAVQAAAIAKSIADGLQSGSDVTDLKAKLAEAEAEIAEFDVKIADAGSKGSTGLKQTTAAARDTTTAVEDTAKAADKAAESFGDLSADGGDSLGQLDQALQNTRQKLLDVSTAAAAAFDAKLPADFFDAFDSTGIGFAKVIEGMNEASADVTTEINNQRTQLQGEIADINQLGADGSSNFGQFGDSAETATTKMKSLSDLIASGNYDAGLLGQQELQPLQQALDAAAQRAQALVDAAKSANDQLADLNNQLLDAIDEATGNKEDQEDRRFTTQLQQIQDLFKTAGQLGSDAFNQAIANADKLHQLNMQQIEQENAAKSGGSSSGSGSSSSKQTGGGIGGSGASTSSGDSAGFGGVTFNIRIDTAIGSDLSKVGEQIGPAVLKYMRNLQAKTTGPILTGR